MYKACGENHAGLVESLLKNNPNLDINREYPRLGLCRLFEGKEKVFERACLDGHSEVVDVLLKYKGQDIDVNELVYGCVTPLWHAVVNRKKELVKILLKQKDIDVNKKGQFNCTPLWVACHNQQLEAIKALLNHEKIDVNKGRAWPCCDLNKDIATHFKNYYKRNPPKLRTPLFEFSNKMPQEHFAKMHSAVPDPGILYLKEPKKTITSSVASVNLECNLKSAL